MTYKLLHRNISRIRNEGRRAKRKITWSWDNRITEAFYSSTPTPLPTKKIHSKPKESGVLLLEGPR